MTIIFQILYTGGAIFLSSNLLINLLNQRRFIIGTDDLSVASIKIPGDNLNFGNFDVIEKDII